MIDALQRHLSDIATWIVPKGGFYIWLRLLPSLSIREVFEKALEKGILLNPGNVYNQYATQYLRLSYAYASLANLNNGIVRLSEVIRQLSRAPSSQQNERRDFGAKDTPDFRTSSRVD
jgi:GntR family transcriptional regulator of abcA and norABC